MTYVNPFGLISNLRAERIDQGVDYACTGPIRSVGNGVIEETENSGWPGGAFIAIRLTDGPQAGHVVYYAEDITPLVTVGQSVTAGQVIGNVFAGTAGIEVGWGNPNAIGESMARAAGQTAPVGDPGDVSTAYGASFSAFLISLGAPGGILQGPVNGTVSPGYPTPEGTHMTRTMYDALEASGIPHGAQIACWYPHDPRSDGPPVEAELVLTIDNQGSHPDCQILDVEPGAAWPPNPVVPDWLDANRNEFPTIYCSESNVGAVVQAAGSRDFYLWVAEWNGSPTEIFQPQDPTVKSVAHQYASGPAFDTSVVYDVYPWYEPASPPPPPPPPPPPSPVVLLSALEYRGVTLRYGGGTPPWTVVVWEFITHKIVFNSKWNAAEVGVQPLTPGMEYAWQVTDAYGRWSPVETFTISLSIRLADRPDGR